MNVFLMFAAFARNRLKPSAQLFLSMRKSLSYSRHSDMNFSIWRLHRHLVKKGVFVRGDFIHLGYGSPRLCYYVCPTVQFLFEMSILWKMMHARKCVRTRIAHFGGNFYCQFIQRPEAAFFASVIPHYICLHHYIVRCGPNASFIYETFH